MNYALRGMVVPGGDHEIIFEFHPHSYFAGSTVSLISSILLLLIFIGAIYWEFRKKTEDKEEKADQKEEKDITAMITV